MNKPLHVLIIGGGYVSVWAYRSLVKKLRPRIRAGKIKITVVSPYDYHLFHGWTAESLTGVIQNEHRRSLLAEIVPLATIIKGTAEKVDTDENILYVTREDGRTESVHFDHLVLGFGSYDSGGVEGIDAYGYRVKAPQEFDRCYNAILQRVKQAAVSDAETAQQLLTFTVAGAGMTGVEMAANLDEYLLAAKSYYPALNQMPHRVNLINSGDQLVSALKPSLKKIRKYIESKISLSNVKVISNTRLERITAGGAILADGTFLPGSMVISTVGQCRFLLRGSEHLLRDATQRLCTNEFFQVAGCDNIWGGGDACHVPYRKTYKACVSDALWAIKHGEYAGNNIARAIQGKVLKPFMYKGLGQAASLGMGKAVGELYGFQFTGMLAWVLRLIFFNYFMPSRRMMMKVIGDWLFLFFKGQRRGLHAFHSSGRKYRQAQALPHLQLNIAKNHMP